MRQILLALSDRLEKQDLLLLTISDRIEALQQTFDLYHSEAVDDRLRLFDEVHKASHGAREAVGSLHEDLRRLISQVQD